MAFELFYLPSYERCVKKLGNREKEIASLIVSALQLFFRSNLPISGKPCVIKLEQRSHRLVFKRLRGNIWEAYIEGQVRLLTRLNVRKHYLVFAGNHDQVQQFLRQN